MIPSYEWDENKRIANLKKHGIDFLEVVDFEWEHAVIYEDVREAYFEERYQALSFIGNRLVMLVFTMKEEDIRLISLRPATSQERKRYEHEQY